MLNASKVTGKAGMKKEILDPGVYPGRVVQLIDLGLQEQRPYQGKEKAPVNEVMLTYELADEFMFNEAGEQLLDKPRWISETFAFHSINAERAKSTARYTALDPDNVYGGDFTKLLGLPCNITVVVNPGRGTNAGKEYENVAGIAPMRKKDADKLPPLVNPTKLFDLDAPDLEVFTSLPDWVKEKIKKNLNYNGSKLQGLLKEKPVVAEDDKQDEPTDTPDERPY